MPVVRFTPNLARQTSAPPSRVSGESVGAALDAVFSIHPGLRAYILNDQGGVRMHVTVFVDGQPIKDRGCLSDATSEESEIFVMQALSGG